MRKTIKTLAITSFLMLVTTVGWLAMWWDVIIDGRNNPPH